MVQYHGVNTICETLPFSVLVFDVLDTSSVLGMFSKKLLYCSLEQKNVKRN